MDSPNLEGFSYVAADKDGLWSDWKSGQICRLFDLVLRQHPEATDASPGSEWPSTLGELKLSFSIGTGPAGTLHITAHLHFDSPVHFQQRPWDVFPSPGTDWLRFDKVDHHGNATELGIGVAPPNFHVESEPALRQARIWLDTCLSAEGPHFECQSKIRYAIPRRLIEIDSPNQARVVESQQDTPYVALSYCWGSDQAKLTRSTQSRFMSKEGSASEFSQSIRDAISVTWQLGARHLWVDALCIMQDDFADLVAELGKMADIYEGALFTILAGGAAKCTEGFLRPRQPQTYSASRSRTLVGTGVDSS